MRTGAAGPLCMLGNDHEKIACTVPRMKDFSAKPRVVQFTVDGEVYRGRPYLPAQTMVDFTLRVEAMGETATGSDGFETMMESLEMVLMPDSFRKLKDRMRDPLADLPEEERAAVTELPYQPIELPQLQDILEWLMEEYGLRPTQSSSGSSDGQPAQASGMNSMAATQDVVSISASSPSIGS